MDRLLIRNVEADLHARLKARAAVHVRSLREEACILERTGPVRGLGLGFAGKYRTGTNDLYQWGRCCQECRI